MAMPLATPATTESSTLYFGPWYRRSPFFEKTLEAGCSAYDIYNHMYLPGYYADPTEEYWALLNDVTVWDVSVERIVALTSTSIFGTVYVDSARNAVAHRSTWWQPRASMFVDVDRSPNVSKSSGTLS